MKIEMVKLKLKLKLFGLFLLGFQFQGNYIQKNHIQSDVQVIENTNRTSDWS